MEGKKLRLAKLFHTQSNKICIVPMDHGTTLGPVEGIVDSMESLGKIVAGGADAIVLHKGMLKKIADHPVLARAKYFLHLSVSTLLSKDHHHKVLVSSVEEAVRLGADGVSIHVNLGTSYDTEMIKDLGVTAKLCLDWGMPLLAMMYVCHENKNATQCAHAARLAEELGADIVKVDYPGSSEGLREVRRGVDIPVVIAGGVKTDNAARLLQIVYEAMMAGMTGVAIGRNIFQHQHPERMTMSIRNLVHGEWDLHEALMHLEDEK